MLPWISIAIFRYRYYKLSFLIILILPTLHWYRPSIIFNNLPSRYDIWSIILKIRLISCTVIIIIRIVFRLKSWILRPSSQNVNSWQSSLITLIYFFSSTSSILLNLLVCILFISNCFLIIIKKSRSKTRKFFLLLNISILSISWI